MTSTNWTPPADLISGRLYSWQVRAVNSLGLGAWTVLRYFSIARPTLSAPVGTVSDRTPTFTWSSVTGATSYEVVVVNLATGTRIARQVVAGTNWTPTSDLAIGRYRWYVRAMNSIGFGHWSIYKDFQIV
jgi:hypothetical protein